MNFFGSIVPTDTGCPQEALGWGSFFHVIQTLLSLAVYLGVFFAVLLFAYAGFLFVTNPANPGNIDKAKEAIKNAIIGLVVILGAWLIINSVLVGLGAGSVGSVTGVFSSGEKCAGLTEGSGTTETPTLTPTNPTGTPESDQGGTGANCPVPSQSSMVALPAADVIGGTGLATPATVQNYIAMRAAALQVGIDLKVTSAYRSDATQVSLWNQYCSSGTCGATKVAKPCSLGGTGSNHNSGQALDLNVGCSDGQSNCNTAAYKWLKANGSRWNFNNAVPTDPVHWSPSGH